MPYTIPTFEAIRATYLRDVKNLDAEAHVDADSDNYIRGSGVASAAQGLYHHQNWIARQVLPSTADPEYVEQHASLRGMALKAASKADGTVTITATAGTVPAFGAGLVLTYIYMDEGTGEETPLSLVTTGGWAGGPAPADGIVLACQAVLAGSFPTLEGKPVTLRTAPEGVSTEAAATVYGGSDAESHAELLARLLFRMRNPPGGGVPADYVRWAMEVPGVVWARCHPLRRGIGTVDVVILTSRANGGGVPGPQLTASVQAYIDKKRPVTCPDCMVFAPIVSPVNITAGIRLASGSGTTLPVIKPTIQKELDTRLFDALYPGDAFTVNRALAVIIGVTGINDAAISSPAGNFEGHALTWFRQGTVTLEGM